MRKYLYILFLMMFSGFQMNEVWADDGWVNVFYNDFGGNESSDPLYGSPLENGSTVPYFEVNGDMLPFEFNENCDFGYCVLKHTNGNGGQWYSGGDHTYENDKDKGYFVFFNPSDSPKREVAYKTKLTGLCRGITFNFSAYVADLIKPNMSGSGYAIKLSVGVYEGPDPESALVSESAYQNLSISTSDHSESNPSLDWQKLALTFTLNSDVDEAYFIVSMEQPAANGWDFAIDDIRIDVWKPEVKINVDEIFYGRPLNMVASFANNGFFSDMNAVEYVWEYSSNGINFSKVGEGSYSEDPNFTYSISSFDRTVNNGYYRVTIGQRGNMDSKVCTLTQTIQINELKDKKKVTLCSDDKKTIDGIEFDAKQWNDNDIRTVGNIDYYISKKEPKSSSIEDEYACFEYPYDGVAEEYKGVIFGPDHEDIDMKKEYYDEDGCLDSVVTWKIRMTGESVLDRAKMTICQGKEAYGKVYNEPGVFTQLDSVKPCYKERAIITVNPTYDMTETIYLCQDESFNGKQYHEKGTFYDTQVFQTKDCHCDSTVGYTIHVQEKTYTTLEPVTICYGESFEFDGKVYTEPKTYNLEKEFSNSSSGCDSIVRQRLTIIDKIENKDNPIDTLICYDSKLFGVLYHEPTPIGSPILVRDPVTYSSMYGCDSIVWYNLTVLQIQLKLEIKSDRNTVCKGEEVEIYIKELIPNNVPFTWYPNLGGANSSKKNFTPTGDMDCVVKAERVIDANSTCQTTDTIHVYVRESPVLSIDSVNQKENVVGYSVTGGTEPYQLLLDKKEVGSDPSGELHDSPIGSHKLVAVDKNECEDAAYFEITPIPVIPATYFTPNNDGVNDTWLIENVDVYPRCNVKIYDRFGRIVYEQDAYDNEDGWDGTYAGNPLPASDYWYVINLPESDRQLMGHFTLIR